MRKIGIGFLIACLAIVFGCARQKPVVIEEFVYQKVIVKEKPVSVEKKEKVIDIGQVPLTELVAPDIRIYFPDPTRGYIRNQTYNIFIKVWLNRDFRPEARERPDFYLPPKAIVEAVMPLGDHSVYAEGLMQTGEYGWKSVGVAIERVSIDHRVYYGGHYGWKAIFRQGDFQR